MNKVMLIGNLTRDPELTQSSTGVSMCRFGIAVNRRFSASDEVDFFNITAWRSLAENCAKYLKKGAKACVIGAVQIRNYEKDGEKRTSVDVAADDVEFLTPKSESERADGGYDRGYSGAPASKSSGGRAQREVSELEPIEVDDELPF